MLDDYITNKKQILGRAKLSKAQEKAMRELKQEFKAQLSSMIPQHEGAGVKTKHKRNISANQRGKLKLRGEIVKKLMRNEGMTLGEASKSIKKWTDGGLSLEQISKSL